MVYCKNKSLLFVSIIILLLVSTIPTYAQDSIVSITNTPDQTKQIETEKQLFEAKNIEITSKNYNEPTVKKYDKLCQTAEEIINKKNYEKAIIHLDKAIKLCPQKEKAYALKSLCLRLLLKTEEAKDNAQIAYRLNPDSYIANEEMGAICCIEGNYKKAIFFLDKAEQLNKNYERIYSNRGLAYYLSNEYEKSIADFNKAIKINPVSISAHEYRAYAYLDLDAKKNAQLALSDANFLIQHNPKNMNWYSLRAKCFANMNNVAMALSDINKVVKSNPNNFESYIERLKIYKLINASNDLIIKDINSAERSAGNDLEKILILAKTSISYNNKISERLVNKVLDKNPVNQDALFLKASIQVSNEDFNNALILLKKIEASNTDIDLSPDFYLIRAMAKFGLAGLDNKLLIKEGIADMNMYINKEDVENWVYVLRGAAHILLEEYQLGINDIKKAEELAPLPKDAVYWLGLANFKLGKIKLNTINDEDNVYTRIINIYCPKSNYSLEDLALGVEIKDSFDNTPEKDISAKINFLSLLELNINFIDSNSLMNLIYTTESRSANIEQAYEQNGKIITLPYKNINGNYGDGLSQTMKDKIIANLSLRAIIAALQKDEDIDTPLTKFLETATTKQKIDGLLTIIDQEDSAPLIDYIPHSNTFALKKIIDNISLYDSSIKTEQDKIKKILRKAYIKLAVAEEDENDFESAMLYYDIAIQYGYPKFDVYSNFAYHYFDEEDYFNASKWATKALNTKRDANMYALRGDAKAELNDYDGAIYDYTKALGYNPKLHEVYFSRANMYFEQRKWSMAQADYIKYTLYNKKEPSAPFNIATCLQNQGKKQAAIPWYEKAKSLYQESGNEENYNECVRRINRIKGYDTWW